MTESPGQLGVRSWAWLARLPWWTWDALPVALLGSVLALNAAVSAAVTGRPHPGGLALGVAAVVPLVARRRFPLAVLGLTGASTFAAAVTGRVQYAGPIMLAVLVALYTVDTRCSRRWSLAASCVTLAGAVLAAALSRTTVSVWHAAIAPAALTLALWVIGDNLRVRRAYVAGLEERARLADTQRAAETRRAAEDERARIARELHDVVAHHVAVMAVQAGAARMLNDGADERTRTVLTTIENTAHQAMSELRRLLGVLRHERAPGDGHRPPPGLGQLAELIEQVRQAGLPAELALEGDPRGLPDWVDLSVYRIVQEALTNVLKHAGPVPTTVWLRRAPGEVTLRVTNTAGTGPAAVAAGPAGHGPAGHGLIGMRERVAMAGGELTAGPVAGGGFEVTARLPVETVASVPELAPELP